MHLAPTTTEFQFLEDANSEDRLNYFLTRSMECEDVWGLHNESGWVLKEDSGDFILAVWNYDILAAECAQGEWSDYKPDSISLEHFIYHTLPQMDQQEIMVEILPSPQKPGLLIEAGALFEIFERKLDTVEYFIEG